MRYNLKGTICADEDAPIYRWFGLAAACPADIRQALADNPDGEEFVLEINSGGGSVYAGFEMYSLLRGAKVPTRAEVQSLAGSAASVVLAAVDTAAASPVGQVMVTVQCIDEVGDRYETETARLYEVTETLTAAFLQRGALICGDRRLTADRIDVSRSLDIADVTITVIYEDDRPAAPETQPIIEDVSLGTAPKEA